MEFLHIPSLWPAFFFTLGTMLLTSISISLYLHRSLAHRSVEFSLPAQRIFRCWIWLATLIYPEEWVRDHWWYHDGHDPDHTVDPSDAPGHHAPHIFGNSLMLAIDAGLFGWWIGCSVFAVQLLWSLFLSGLIFGRYGHVGKRNFVTDDMSVDIPWLSFPTCGESLANSHHVCRESAWFAEDWKDFGWFLIGLLRQAGLVTEWPRVTPTLSFSRQHDRCVTSTFVAVSAHLPYFLRQLPLVFEADFHKRLEFLEGTGHAFVVKYLPFFNEWFYWDKGGSASSTIARKSRCFSMAVSGS